ncbi:N-acetylmuramoyl-L-alanine amidase [Haliscomenobacter sp.]|uniref:N-acetylmuramoyl-L-alanine amidase family protein n=1 Tax=Haliscomenobacter sp. TaxID=2717303 RepID=UPI00359394A4
MFTFQTKLILISSAAILGFNISLAAFGLGPGKVIQSPRIPTDKLRNYSLSDSLLQKSNASYQLKTVVIDAGHGGHDPGCHGASAHEKHVTLAIAKKLGEQLQQRFPNLKVVLTRDKDVFIPLYERADIANKHNADLFISIHCNAMPGSNSGTYGTETYVMGLHTAQYNLEVAKRENAAILLEDNYQKNYDYDPNSPEGHIMISMFQNAYLKQSLQFAELVENKLNLQAKRKSRGVKQAGFVVLKATAMPSVLVEVGFLTNPSEEQFLNGQYGQDQVAGAMLEAFTLYKNHAESPDFNTESQYENSGQKEAVATTNAETPIVYSYGASNQNNSNIAAVQNENRNPELAKSKEIPAPERANDPGGNSHNATTNSNLGNAASASRYGPVPPGPNVNRNPVTNNQTMMPPPVTNLKTTPPPVNNNNPQVSFKIQLAAGPVAPNQVESKWKSFPFPIEVAQEDNLYKIRTQAYTDYQQANQVRSRCKELGFNDAFIVAMKDGKRISLAEAKKVLGIP